MQLRYNSTAIVNHNYPVMNYGSSKGMDFDRVLIYPTEWFIKWLINGDSLAITTLSKLYVAITRAKQSVAIIYDYKENDNVEGIEKLTGVNQGQLSHYVTGRRKPSKKTVDKIKRELHHFADEISQIEFV